MGVLCSTDTGICYLAAEVSADFIKVEKKKAHSKKQQKMLYVIYHIYSYFLILVNFLLTSPFLFCNVCVHAAVPF